MYFHTWAFRITTGLAVVDMSKQGHAQDFRDRTADALMGRKTIPLLLPPRVARWSLAVLIAGWTASLIALWQPPLAASILFAGLGLRSLGGYLWSHDENDDYRSYVWYGVSGAFPRPIYLADRVLTFVAALAPWKQPVAHFPSIKRRDVLT